MVEITSVVLGVPGPAGVGITAAEKAALAPKASPTFTGTVTAAALNVTGATTLDGNVNLGNASTDTTTITGHLNFAGSAPSLVAGAALGSTGTVALEFGNDSRGCIKFTPGGTGISSGIAVNFTFNVSRANALYIVILSAADGDAGDLHLWNNQVGQTNSAFTIRSNTVLVSGTEYRVNYWIVE